MTMTPSFSILTGKFQFNFTNADDEKRRFRTRGQTDLIFGKNKFKRKRFETNAFQNATLRFELLVVPPTLSFFYPALSLATLYSLRAEDSQMGKLRTTTTTTSTFCLLLLLIVPTLSFLSSTTTITSSRTTTVRIISNHQKGHHRYYLYSGEKQDDGTKNDYEDNNNSSNTSSTTTTTATTPVCRIVSRADSKLPTSKIHLPESLFEEPYLLEKLDAYYNAQAYKRSKSLSYLQQQQQQQQQPKSSSSIESDDDDDDDYNDDISSTRRQQRQQKQLISSIKDSLEDAGFQLLSRRDLDLCDSLNVGYLLRLSIAPDVSDLDPDIFNEFYPPTKGRSNDDDDDVVVDVDDVLFEGRCLVFWRGYSKEVTTGRLILPKIDYLQTSLVQRSTSWVKKRLDDVEVTLSTRAGKESRKLQTKVKDFIKTIPVSLPTTTTTTRAAAMDDDDDENTTTDNNDKEDYGDRTTPSTTTSGGGGGVNLGRYGGKNLKFVGSPDPDDALDPFMICEVEYKNTTSTSNDELQQPQNGTTANTTTTTNTVTAQKLMMNKSNDTTADQRVIEYDMYDKLNHQGYTCEYDEKMTTATTNNINDNQQQQQRRMHLLERVSINNLINVFSRYGRKTLVRTLFSKSKLVEPTYEEVRNQITTTQDKHL